MTIASLIVEIGANTLKFQGDVEKVNSTLDKVVNLAGKVAAGLGLAFTAEAILSGIKNQIAAAIAYGDALVNMRAKTELTYRDLQILEDVGLDTGTSLATLVSAVQVLQQRLGDGSARKGVEALHLSFDALLAMSPAEQLTTIASAIAKIEDPTVRAKVAAEIFGKTWKEMLPALKANMAEAAANANLVGDKQLEAANRASSRWDKFWNDQKRGWTSWAGNIILNWENVQEHKAALDAFEAERTREMPALPGSPLTDATGNVGGAHLAAMFGGKAHWNDVIDPTAIGNLKLGGQTLDQATEALTKHEAAVKKAADEWDRLVEKAGEGARSKWQQSLDLMHAFDGILGTLDSWSYSSGMAKFGPGVVSLTGSTNYGGGVFDGPAKLGSKTFDAGSKSFASDLFGSVPGAIMGAIQGGGSKLQAAGSAIGLSIFGKDSSLTKTITGWTSKLPGMLGDALGSAIPVIGSLIGPLISGITKIFGKSEETAKVSPVRDEFFKMAGGLETLNPKVQQLTGSLTLVDNIFKAKTVDAYNAAIKDLTDALAFQDKAMQTLTDTAAKYGFTLEELGPALQRQDLDKQAQQLYQDFQVLNAGGLDSVAILTHMADSVNEYVHNALSMGVEVPNAMRPMLEDLAKSGKLLDLNGNAITNLEDSGISFAMTMSEGFTKLIDQVTKLTDAIARGLGIAIDNVPKQIDVNANVHFNNEFDYRSSDNVIPMAGGGRGRVTGPTLFYSGGNEDFAFSGEGKGFGGDNAVVAELLDVIRRLPRAITTAQRDALLQAG